MINVLRMHRDASFQIERPRRPPTFSKRPTRLEEAVDLASRHGVRNAQATVARADGHDRTLDGLRHHRHRPDLDS